MRFFPLLLLILYLALMIWLGLEPYDRLTWFAENLPVWIVVGLLVITYPKFQFSNLSYFLMWFFLCFHTIGGHYTFGRVPIDFISEFFGWERNNYDRIGHFFVGVFAYPAAELTLRQGWITRPLIAILFGVFAVSAWAALYEVIEMFYAVTFGGDKADDFLGSQGDIWDAQWDMAMDILGGILAGVLFWKYGQQDSNSAHMAQAENSPSKPAPQPDQSDAREQHLSSHSIDRAED